MEAMGDGFLIQVVCGPWSVDSKRILNSHFYFGPLPGSLRPLVLHKCSRHLILLVVGRQVRMDGT
jgi:hypothetical protein